MTTSPSSAGKAMDAESPMTLAAALAYLKPDPANKGTISLKAPKAREAVEAIEAAIAALRSKDREDGAREMRESIRLMFAHEVARCYDASDKILSDAQEGKYPGTNEEALKRSGISEKEADGLLNAWKLIAALPLTTRTEDGDA